MRLAGPEALGTLLDAALQCPGADDVEVYASHSWGGLTRFAASRIHQSTFLDDTEVTIRVVSQGRVGVASTSDPTPAGAAQAAAHALAAAHHTPPDPTFAGLAGPALLPALHRRYDEATATASPAARAGAVVELVGRLRPGQDAAGTLGTSAREDAVATTAGCRAYAAATSAVITTVVSGDGATGYDQDSAAALDDLDPGAVGAAAAATCAAAADPAPAQPGIYEVVVLAPGVATLVEHLAWVAFGARDYAEGRSAFNGRLGEQVASPLMTIADDALAPGTIGLPFDPEGTPRRRVELIRAGVAAGLVHDRATAAAAGTTSTGHALPPPNVWGPQCSHLVLEPGDQSVDDLVAGIDRGLLVTRFWYTRIVHPTRTTATGMTRDGTFEVRGGEVGPPVTGLRYNQSILDALASCDGVGARLGRGGDETLATRTPALRLRSFSFSTSTDH